MLTRIALLLGVLCVPVLLALASQSLAESTDPPQMPEPATTSVAELPTGAAPARAGSPASASDGAAAGGAQAGAPQAVQIEPRPVGTPADLDGDRDDDGIPDSDDESGAPDIDDTTDDDSGDDTGADQ